MTSPVRLLLIAAAVSGTLSACNRDREDAPAPAPAPGALVTPADAAAPMSFDAATEYAKVKLTLPDAIKPQTDLHARLYAEEVRKLRQYLEGAQADRTEAGGETAMGPYEKTITITAAAQTGKLFSLRRMDFDYSGGAHPNTVSGGMLWDKATRRVVLIGELFKPGADLTVLDQALCSAINTAKSARTGQPANLTLGSAEWACPRAIDTPFVLSPGSTPGKAAGLTFLLGQYAVGPYAEGAYDIVIPHTLFRSLLAPAYADEFAGQPIKIGDVTPTA